MGTYEREQVIPFTKSLFSNAVVFDVGAQSGYYAMIASRRVGERGKVIAFEPLPENILYLRKNVQLNRRKNLRIIESAISDNDGVVLFSDGTGTHTGKIDPCGKLKVNSKSIDSMIQKDRLEKPDVLKVDVEGEEYRVLLGARHTIAKFKPKIFLSIHNSSLEKSCISFLHSMNYHIIRLQSKKEYVSEIMAS